MNWVLAGVLVLLALGYATASALGPARRRRREARAVRVLLLREIHSGQRSFDDPAVRELLAWCRTRSAASPQAALDR